VIRSSTAAFHVVADGVVQLFADVARPPPDLLPALQVAQVVHVRPQPDVLDEQAQLLGDLAGRHALVLTGV
jgi:hypothetical protein